MKNKTSKIVITVLSFGILVSGYVGYKFAPKVFKEVQVHMIQDPKICIWTERPSLQTICDALNTYSFRVVGYEIDSIKTINKLQYCHREVAKVKDSWSDEYIVWEARIIDSSTQYTSREEATQELCKRLEAKKDSLCGSK